LDPSPITPSLPNTAQQTDASFLIAIEDQWGAHNYHPVCMTVM
jgi:hypothetical protein